MTSSTGDDSGPRRGRNIIDELNRALNDDNATTLMTLIDLLESDGRYDEAEQWMRRGADHGNPLAASRLASLLERQRRFEEAIAAHEKARAIFVETDDRRGEGAALNDLGNALQRVGRFEEAIAAHEKARAIFVETDDRRGEGAALNDLGNALQRVGRSDDAATASQHASEIFRALGNEEAGAAEGRSPTDDMQSMSADSAPRLVVPKVADDLVVGPDRLGIEADARALAALAASRGLEPPVAIGVYGEWGSGKTFFMKRIEDNVQKLTVGSGGGGPILGGTDVAHVWFNAWHYAHGNGNLWASLLRRIFESLHPKPDLQKEALEAAMKENAAAEQVVADAQGRVTAAKERAAAAAAAIEAATKRHKQALEEIENRRTRDLLKYVKIDDYKSDLPELSAAAEKIRIPAAVGSVQEIAGTVRVLIDLASRGRVLATAGTWYKSPLALSIWAATIVAMVGLCVVFVGDATGSMATTLTALATTGAAAAAWITRQANLVRELLAPAERIKARLDADLADEREKQNIEMAALQQDARATELELAVAMEQNIAAAAALVAAEKERDELKGSKLLYRYLAERAGSGDYDQYLGLVALAHRDLENLSKHLTAAIADTTSESLSRIVLYIDDLDRCDPDTVADVLDAVHLLLALPLFVVIVGVDPRWLAKSLRHRHPDLLADNASATTAGDYLEKIFHLTYTLPRMTPQGCATLLTAAANRTQQRVIDEYRTVRPTSSAVAQIDGTPNAPGAQSSGEEQATSVRNVAVTDEVTVKEMAGVIEAMTLTESDIEALGMVAPLVGGSPRRAKRFLSVYLVIRARVRTDDALRTRFEWLTPDSLLLTVALLIEVPKSSASALGPGITISEPSSTTSHTFGQWVAELQVSEPETDRLQSFITMAGRLNDVPMHDIVSWFPVVAPYTGSKLVVSPSQTPSVPTNAPIQAYQGTVKFFNAKKGFGFIAQVGGKPDVFVHYLDLPPGIEALSVGQQVEFKIEQVPKGLQARNVRLI